MVKLCVGRKSTDHPVKRMDEMEDGQGVKGKGRPKKTIQENWMSRRPKFTKRTQSQAPRRPFQCLGAQQQCQHHTSTILAPRCPNSTQIGA
ncbi:hypothetical protein PIB30_013080 [Stylosanthes scabra]|uniref:Uncharacterized protein n=1 Tax=Stylosanthes scabra TaxID=79078 RepID=A0ABU6U5M5_9FABA|nr:hypothetical protein [Stylosanthes scabra]